MQRPTTNWRLARRKSWASPSRGLLPEEDVTMSTMQRNNQRSELGPKTARNTGWGMAAFWGVAALVTIALILALVIGLA